MWYILIKDGIYCIYSEWICSSKENIIKAQTVIYGIIE